MNKKQEVKNPLPWQSFLGSLTFLCRIQEKGLEMKPSHLMMEEFYNHSGTVLYMSDITLDSLKTAK